MRMTTDARSVSRLFIILPVVLLLSIATHADPLLTSILGPNGCRPGSGSTDHALCSALNELVPEAGQTYTDANFGGSVTALSGPGSVHAASVPTPLSAHNKYALLRQLSSGISRILDPFSGQ